MIMETVLSDGNVFRRAFANKVTKLPKGDVCRRAEYSACLKYRYNLEIIWDDSDARRVQFIGLNPSTATEIEDDPTLRRCKAFAKCWGFGGIIMTNIFAFRATDPRLMKAAPFPVAPASTILNDLNPNDHALVRANLASSTVVAAWGTHGAFQARGNAVLDLLSVKTIWCLGKNEDGSPKHPLYLAAATELDVFWVRKGAQ